MKSTLQPILKLTFSLCTTKIKIVITETDEFEEK